MCGLECRKQLVKATLKGGCRRRMLVNEGLLGVNFNKQHGLEMATQEPRTGDERQSTPAK